MQKFIVVMGNPVDGFTHIGPFEFWEDANKYCEDDPSPFDMWVVMLQEPSHD